MNTILWSLALSILVAAPSPTDRFGGWATISVEKLPDKVVTGQPLDLVFVVKQHGTTPLSGGANFVDLTEVYSTDLRQLFTRAAIGEEITLHEGVYAGLHGPQYETPAEIRMLQILGADAVGMSTVLEAIQARALGLEVAGFSCLTNYGAGLGAAPLSHDEVLKTGGEAAALFTRLMHRVLRSI